jgi:hypothetical protein
VAEFDYSEFWTFGEAWVRGAARVKWVNWTPDLSKRDERLRWVNDTSNGRIVPDAPIPFRQDEGRRWLDWVGSSLVSFKLVSDRLIGVLREQRATGWSTYPVQVTARNGDEIAGYHGFAVTAHALPRWDMSQPTIVPPPVPEGSAITGWKGLFFEAPSWNGSDVFSVDGQIVCTSRVHAALSDADLTNVSYECVTDWMREWDVR